MTHCELVQLAAQWLAKKHPIVVTELVTQGEEPDALGWLDSRSTLVECKASVSDFRADASKVFRANPEFGIGTHRFYLAPAGVIPHAELPEGWGLLEVTGPRLRKVRDSQLFSTNARQEIRILLSCLRRIGHTAPAGISIRCYTSATQNKASIIFDTEECHP